MKFSYSLPRALSHLPATSTHDLRRNHVTVHLVNTIAGSTRIKPTIINDFTHLFIAHYFHLEIRSIVATMICVLIDTPLVRVATGLQRSTIDQGTCICRTSIVVWIVGIWRCIATGTSTILSLGSTSTISFTTLSTGNDSLFHDSELSISQ